MPITFFLAVQFLREGRTQSTLITSAVGVGVTVIVFLSALISGLQTSLIDKTLGAQAHVVLRPQEEQARPLLADDDGSPIVVRRAQRPVQRPRSLLAWQQTMAQVQRDPRVLAVSPVVSGPAFAVRGTASKSVAVLGIDPASYGDVVRIEDRFTLGALPRNGNEVALGQDLAADLGVGIGDKLRLQVADGRFVLSSVAGIFELGNREVDERWVLVSLRAGQTLLGLEGGVSRLEIRVAEIFEAEQAAAALGARTGYVAESWMETNAELLTALRSQSSSSLLIQVFVILAVTIGIASVLVVSVVQKQREIGILRAMGMSRAKTVWVFVLQGGLLGLLGSIVGVAAGAGVSRLFATIAVDTRGEPLFPFEVDARLLLTAAATAVATGLIAALLPAARAGRLDPADAIRQ